MIYNFFITFQIQFTGFKLTLFTPHHKEAQLLAICRDMFQKQNYKFPNFIIFCLSFCRKNTNCIYWQYRDNFHMLTFFLYNKLPNDKV